MEDTKRDVGISIYQACKDIHIKYLRPEVTIRKNEFLFLIDIQPNLLIFKTEDDVTIMLPESVLLNGSVREVF